MVGQDTVTASPGLQAGVDERAAVGEIGAWGKRYVRSHPLQSLETVGGQTMLGGALKVVTVPWATVTDQIRPEFTPITGG